MPTKPRQPCSNPLCLNLQPCPIHKRRSNPTKRMPWQRFYLTAEWQAMRRRVLREEPTCDGWPVGSRCGRPTTDVDHIVPFRPEEGGARLDRANLRAMCHACHSRKTLAEVKARAKAERS